MLKNVLCTPKTSTIFESELEINTFEREVKKSGLELHEICPECKSERIIKDYRRGEVVCQDCGLVIQDNCIDSGPEWTSFNDQERYRDRTGMPLSYMYHDLGLSTEIGYAKGCNISHSQLLKLRMLQKRIRIRTGAERGLTQALQEINRLGSALGLPHSVREAAAMIYRKAAANDLIKGWTIEGFAAASLYAACKQASIPRTLKEVAMHSRTSKREIGRTYKRLLQNLDLKFMPANPAEYIPRFCAALGLSGGVQKRAVEIIKKAEEIGITSGKCPIGIAAAAIYIASLLGREKRTQGEVAKACGVTEVTIRSRYKDLVENLPIQILDKIESSSQQGVLCAKQS